MAHELDFSTGRAAFAYVGKPAWHGFGDELQPGQPLEVWQVAAGMDFTVEREVVRYRLDTPTGKAYAKVPDRHVLYRSDTKAPLGVVSNRYQIVQPHDVLEFFRDLVAAYDYQLETAGCLFDGARFWALARTPDADFVADKRDGMRRYLMLATAVDGSMATTGKNTAVRVVCANTMAASLSGGGDVVKVSHRSTFDADAVKRELGIQRQSWDEFMTEMRRLASTRVSRITAAQAAVALFPTTKKDADPVATFQVQSVLKLFDGNAKGSGFAGVDGTAWGFINAVTEFVDHHARAHNDDNRRDSAWFGRGAVLKSDAVRVISELAA